MQVSTHHPQDPALHHIKPSESLPFRELRLEDKGTQCLRVCAMAGHRGSTRGRKTQVAWGKAVSLEWMASFRWTGRIDVVGEDQEV